jgi:hypothetical protein
MVSNSRNEFDRAVQTHNNLQQNLEDSSRYSGDPTLAKEAEITARELQDQVIENIRQQCEKAKARVDELVTEKNELHAIVALLRSL